MFKWDEKYSVEIQSIDNQHKEIFRLMGNLLEAMKQGQVSIVIAEIFLELEKYAMSHFQKEEYFFIRFNYSGTEAHITEHRFFSQKVTLLKSDLNSGKVAASFELLNFLKEWIEHHILVVDKQYSECFRQNGLK
jgi:methyl-accepting chemotaxis protein/hemerythrin